MRTTRRLLVPVLLLALTAIPLAAQGGQGRQGGQAGAAQRQNEILFKGITLTATQQAAVDSIQAATREAGRALMQEGGMGDPAAREKAMELRTQSHADMRKLLTPEQAAIFDKNLEEMPQRGAGRRPPR